jgi:drug/metabolite transporter (DMT)-like permease
MNRQAIATLLAPVPVRSFASARLPFGVEVGGGILLALLAGAGDCLGHLCYALSAANGEISVAVAVSALFPAVSVLLAILLLKERIGRLQSIGLAVSAGSIVLLAGV